MPLYGGLDELQQLFLKAARVQATPELPDVDVAEPLQLPSSAEPLLRALKLQPNSGAHLDEAPHPQITACRVLDR